MKGILGFLGTALVAGTVASALAEDGKLTVSDLTFKFSAPWKAVGSASPMRAGTLQYEVAGLDKPIEAVFYFFGAGQGGDVEANVARWFSQFEGEPEKSREEVAAGDKKFTIVKASGTYLDGPPFGPKTPKQNYALLGAIVPAADANVFIKLTGPKDAVSKLLDEFKKLAASPFAKP